MKRLNLLFCFILFTHTNYAQYVTIPDTAFVTWLQTHGLDSCMSGNQLDTTCQKVLTTTTISFNLFPIRELTGIQYFKSLTTLICTNGSLTFIPAFPASLTAIACPDNSLSALPQLPPNLQTLNCGFNPINFLPSLPSGLITLQCTQDSLTSLPDLPEGLQTLYCNYNPLRTLPVLPNSLTFLDCIGDSLTSLPELPDSMVFFSCAANPNLVCMPTLKRVVSFYFNLTGVTCLQNYGNVTSSEPALSSIPLCTEGNANGCAVSGINELYNSNTVFSVYPNPANDKLVVDYPILNARLKLIDMTGKVWTISPMGNEINISTLQAGIYCIQIQTATGIAISRFVKE